MWTLRKSIDPDQSSVDFLFQESLHYTYIPPETECIGPYQSARAAQADLDRYNTQVP